MEVNWSERYKIAEEVIWNRTPHELRGKILKAKVLGTTNRYLDAFAKEVIELAESTMPMRSLKALKRSKTPLMRLDKEEQWSVVT